MQTTYNFTDKYRHEWTVRLLFNTYSTGNWGMTLVDQNGLPVLVASKNLTKKIATDEIAIKDYAENKGVLDFLIREGIVSEPLRQAPAGHTTVPICKLLISPNNY